MCVSRRITVLCTSILTFLLLSLSCQVSVPLSPMTLEAETSETAMPEGEDMGFTYYIIGQSLKVSHGRNLTIVASDILQVRFVDEQGVTRTEFMCTLLLNLRDGSLPYQGGRFHAGQEIVYGEYLIRVVEIDRDDYGPFVHVGIREREDVGVEWPVTVRGDGEGPYEIPANAQLIYHDDNLLIGAGNFFLDDEDLLYQEDACGLWLAVRDGSLPNQHVRVRGGQEVAYGVYLIEVAEVRDYYYRLAEDISRTGFTPSVRISVSVVQDSE